MNVLLFSRDPIALDATACRMIDLDPEMVPTSTAGEKAGLGTYHSENIELAGDCFASFINRDFKVTRKPPVRIQHGRFRTFLRNRLTARPFINRDKCTKCGTCLEMCPVGPTALDWMEAEAEKVPRMNYNRCIRCFCCQETCPEGAIDVRTPFLVRLLSRK
jgi:formate hydrogenlyase subunit 6/NADH:ubiquinone oxidoreductase subunit I